MDGRSWKSVCKRDEETAVKPVTNQCMSMPLYFCFIKPVFLNEIKEQYDKAALDCCKKAEMTCKLLMYISTK